MKGIILLNLEVYFVAAEFGDYDADKHGDEFLNDYIFLPPVSASITVYLFILIASSSTIYMPHNERNLEKIKVKHLILFSVNIISMIKKKNCFALKNILSYFLSFQHIGPPSVVKSLTDKVCYHCCVVCLVLMTLYLILFVGFQVPHETCVS